MMDLLDRSPVLWAAVVFAVVGSIVLHELGHALAATWEGDDTPRLMGHLTWNPVKHMGWLSIGLAAFIGIAWGQTPVNPARFRHRRWGDVIVSFAGPAVNLALAILAAAMIHLSSGATTEVEQMILMFWSYTGFLNLALFMLNMIPVPPLDGFTVAGGFFDMGAFGDLMRRNQPWPLLLVFVILMRSPFFSYAADGVVWMTGVWSQVLPGGA